MSEVLGGLVNWLVVERKADGRCVYDEAAKAELVVLCGQPGASVSKLARQAGVNANQLWRWVRRGKALSSSGCESRPATIAPAGSNRSNRGGNDRRLHGSCNPAGPTRDLRVIMAKMIEFTANKANHEKNFGPAMDNLVEACRRITRDPV